jgi:putative sigma-54 modulation protein
MYAAIDLVEEIIERQLKKYKNKIIESKQDIDSFAKSFYEAENIDDDSIEITRVKKFAVKPMDPEEACIQMELLGHNFYVFRNMETDEVNVVYKRKGRFNSYGLIEPDNT